MSTTTLPRPALVVVPPVMADDVPYRIRVRARAGGWEICDVCRWPVDPAAVVPARRVRHPGCLCVVCGAPLTTIVPGQPWHEPCLAPASGRRRRGRHGR